MLGLVLAPDSYEEPEPGEELDWCEALEPGVALDLYEALGPDVVPDSCAQVLD